MIVRGYNNLNEYFDRPRTMWQTEHDCPRCGSCLTGTSRFVFCTDECGFGWDAEPIDWRMIEEGAHGDYAEYEEVQPQQLPEPQPEAKQ